MKQTAKVFMSGRSQAVRLPAEFRFSVAEVFIRRDPATGDIILSACPSLEELFKQFDACEGIKDWTIERSQDGPRRPIPFSDD